MIKKDFSFLAQRVAVLLSLLLSISCSTGNKIENGRFLELNIGASKEQVFAVIKDDLRVSSMGADDWWDTGLSDDYRLGEYSGTYEQLADVITNHLKIIIKVGASSPEQSYSPSVVSMAIYFENSIVSKIDTRGGYYNRTDDVETLGITVGMSGDDVRDILIRNRAIIRDMYSMSTKRVGAKMDDFDAQYYETMLSFDVWNFEYNDKGIWDEDFYIVYLIFVDNLLYEIQYDWAIVNIKG